MEEKKMAAQWLDTVTAGIRFQPDRKAVQEELAAHLEDKTADFQRIFPDMTRAEAQDRAVSEMGDPVEVGRALAKIHKPWLGYLWRASQWALGLTLTWYLLLSPQLNWWDFGRIYDIKDREQPRSLSFFCEEPVRLGQYTFRVEGARLPLEDDGSESFTVTWRVSSPVFWETPEPESGWFWRGEDSLGNRYISMERRMDRTEPLTDEEWQHRMGSICYQRSGLGWEGEQMVHNVPEEIQWMRLTFELEGQTASVLLTREEEP